MVRILVILVFGLAVSLQASSPHSSMDEFLTTEMLASGAPGLSYGVALDGEISGDQRGVLKVGENTPVGPATPFATGSVSKSFTALGVMQLVEAGKAELDAPVARYLSVFAGKPHGAITLRQLLSHTSGYSTFQGNASQTDFSMAEDALERRVAKVAGMTPPHAPGETWEYSNANYQVLGRVIEVLSGQDFASYIEGNVLAPAGMTDSFVHPGGDPATLAVGHRPWFGSKTANPQKLSGTGSGPQGGIVASGRDMAKYLAIMMNGEDDILSAAGKAQMMQPASNASPFYGFGWFIDADRGTVYHSGSNPGYEALATMIPAQKKGVAVLVNAGSGTGFGKTIQLRNGVTARAIGLDYSGETDPWQAKATFVGLILMPVLFLSSMFWAWRKRAVIRAKSGAFGIFSLWFPLVMTLGIGGLIFGLIPRLFGAPFPTIRLFQPDIGLAMIACVFTGIAWALWRLILAYVPRRAKS